MVADHIELYNVTKEIICRVLQVPDSDADMILQENELYGEAVQVNASYGATNTVSFAPQIAGYIVEKWYLMQCVPQIAGYVIEKWYQPTYQYPKDTLLGKTKAAYDEIMKTRKEVNAIDGNEEEENKTPE